jgi:hypothetical protein
MNELAALRGSPRREVVLFNECGAKTSRSRIQGHSNPSNSATNDQYIELLAFQAFDIGCTVEIHVVSLNAGPSQTAILRHIPFISNLQRFLIRTTCKLGRT